MSQNLHHVDRDDLGLVLIRGTTQGQTMQYLRNLDGQFFWLCARLQMNSPSIRGRLLEAYHSRARTPGALGCGCMIGQPAADNHYTTSLSKQARKPVVHTPWNGYIYSNEKRRFSLHTFFCRPTKESMKKDILIYNRITLNNE